MSRFVLPSLRARAWFSSLTSLPPGSRKTPAALALLVSLGLGALGCGEDSVTDPGVAVNEGAPDVLVGEEPKAGFQFLETTYTVPGTGESRTIRLNLWYATNDEEGTPTRYNVLSRDFDSFLDASVRVPSGQAPLLIYTHGSQAWGGSNHRLARQFVRNGWIVVAPDHTGNTITDNLVMRPFEFDILRAYDVQETLEAVANLPSDHPLAGHIDTSRVLVAGHSYGGMTSWIVGGTTLDTDAIEARCAPDCVQGELDAYAMYQPDSRVVAVVPMAGGVNDNVVADTGFSSMIAPVFYMTGENDNDGEPLFTRSAGADVTWVEFMGGCHESFTGTLGCATLSLEESLPATATYTLAFGIRHVLQSDDAAVAAILDGTTEVAPSAVLMHHGP